LVIAPAPASGQVLVYDPSNYAQNVLQAARALQQINNQITSLQNQTQMLLNQAKNLASLPYSSLQAIEQSIARTQQLVSQAQRLGYDISQITRRSAFVSQAMRAQPPRSNWSAMRRRAGRIRLPPIRTLSGSRPASCKRSIPHARRRTGSSHRVSRPSASFNPAKPAIS
jgi:uncharacterized protein YoxC